MREWLRQFHIAVKHNDDVHKRPNLILGGVVLGLLHGSTLSMILNVFVFILALLCIYIGWFNGESGDDNA